MCRGLINQAPTESNQSGGFDESNPYIYLNRNKFIYYAEWIGSESLSVDADVMMAIFNFNSDKVVKVRGQG